MTSHHRIRASATRHRPLETGRFITTISSSQWTLSHHGQVWRPPTDVYETEGSIVVKVEIAGMAEDDFVITFAERTLIITGVRHDPATKLGYHQMEIPYGEFRTDFYVPLAVEIEEIEASYQDGFLLVVLPKAKSRSIGVDRS